MSKEYEHSAQVVNILGRGAYSIVYNHQLENFVYYHVKYVHPRYILEHDNITMYGITPTHAFFCVTHDPTKNVNDIAVGPFVALSQFIFAQQLIVVPHSTLHRLAEEVGDPTDRTVSIMDMTGRCGSTLICQMMAKVPQVRSLSEPWATVHAHGHYVNGRITLEQLRQLFRSCIRLQCKPEKQSQIDHIFIKMQDYAEVALEAMKHDSQLGIFGTRGSQESKLSAEVCAEIDGIMEECGLPLSLGMSLDELRRLISLS
ncbi:unnamed protein product [Sphagnum tenellum]